MPKDPQKLSVGKDSVVIGNVEGTVGDGSTIVGATDNKGNTILNQEMAVGRGAQAGPGSIAIGAGASAGASIPANRVEIQLNNSIVAVLNAGDMQNVDSISTNISSVASNGHAELVNAFKALTEAIASSNELNATQRTQVLDTVEELTRQANLPEENRSKPEVIRSLLQNLGATLGAAGGLAEVWSTWGESIKAFFVSDGIA